MAGTRLCIQLSFFIQILILIILALLYEFKNDTFQEHLNQRLFSYRDGSLQHEALRTKISSLQRNITSLILHVHIPLTLILPPTNEIEDIGDKFKQDLASDFQHGLISRIDDSVDIPSHVEIHIPNTQLLDYHHVTKKWNLPSSIDCDSLDYPLVLDMVKQMRLERNKLSHSNNENYSIWSFSTSNFIL